MYEFSYPYTPYGYILTFLHSLCNPGFILKCPIFLERPPCINLKQLLQYTHTGYTLST